MSSASARARKHQITTTCMRITCTVFRGSGHVPEELFYRHAHVSCTKSKITRARACRIIIIIIIIVIIIMRTRRVENSAAARKNEPEPTGFLYVFRVVFLWPPT